MNLYSLEREIGLGKQLAQEVERSPSSLMTPSSPNTSIASARTSSATPTPRAFTIKVIDSDEVNAFALPGAFLRQ